MNRCLFAVILVLICRNAIAVTTVRVPTSSDADNGIVVVSESQDPAPSDSARESSDIFFPETDRNVRSGTTVGVPEIGFVVTPLLIDQEYGFLGVTQRSSRLQIEEKTGKASVTGVSFTDVRNPDSNRPVDDGVVVAHLEQNNIAPGEIATATVRLEGLFPLGTTAGRLEIRGDQLTTSHGIEYQIRARRTGKWIVLITAAGFLFGWVVRVFLKERQLLHESLALLSDVVQQIQRTKSEIQDQVLHRQADEILSKLKRSSSSRVQLELKAAADVGLNALQAAVSEYNERRRQAAQRLEAIVPVMQRRWTLPASLAGRVDGVREDCKAIQDKLRHGHVSDAEEQLSRLQGETLVALGNELNSWSRNAAVYLNELVAHPLPQTSRGCELTASAVQSWESLFAGNAGSATTVNPEQLTMTLERVHSGRSAFEDIANHLVRETKKLGSWIDETLDAPLRPLDDQLRELNHCNELAAGSVLQDIDHPQTSLLELPGRRLSLRRNWEALLVAMLAPGTDARGVNEALSAGRWVEAIERTRDLMPRVRGGRSLPAEGMEVAALNSDSTVLANGPVLFRTTFALPLPGLLNTGGSDREIRGTNDEKRGFERTARLASLLQTACLAILFTIVADVIYSPTWVGTNIEMLSLFVWAFGVDVSSEAFMSVIKRVKPPDFVA